MKDSKDGNYALQKKTALQQAAYIDEINKRERKYNTINNIFTLNIKRLKILPEKPNKITKKSVAKIEDIPKEIREQVENHFKTPLEKYSKPMTSSMNYGWDTPSGFKVFKALYSKNTNDITKFADEYYYLKGKSQFASNKVAVSIQKS